jgi:hypothetical protein
MENKTVKKLVKNDILSYDYKNFKSKKGFTFGMSSILTHSPMYELEYINDYRKKLGVNAFCINSSMSDGTKYLLMMNFDKKVFDELAKVKEVSLEFKMYHKSKCEIIKNKNMYKKECTVKMYSDYKKGDDAYNSISEQVEIRSSSGDKEKAEKKDKKEEVEYNAAIFEIKGKFISDDFTKILIGVLNKLNI